MPTNHTEKSQLIDRCDTPRPSYFRHNLGHTNNDPTNDPGPQTLDTSSRPSEDYKDFSDRLQPTDHVTDNGNSQPAPDSREDGEGGEGREGGDGGEGEAFILKSLPKKSLLILLLISLGNFLIGVEFYFMTPFYPKVAMAKGMSETVLGLLFCIVHIAVFTSSPVFGNYLEKLGPRFIYVAGISTGGVTTVLFGLVGMCDAGAPFIALSFLCRTVIGLAISAFLTASFAILTNEFPKHVSRAYGLVEVANGIGFMSGPALGGGLYEAGGFGLPFYVVGGMVITNSVLICLYMPPPLGKLAKRPGGIVTLAKSGLVLVSMANVFMGAIGTCFLESTLATHLSKFDLPTGLIGLVFVIMPFVYGSSSSVVGYIADTKNIQHLQYYSGTLCLVIAYLLIGPSSLFEGMPLKLWVVVICLILIGYSYGSCVVPALKCMVTGAIEIGFPDNLDTYGLVSGAFFTALCFGGFIGNILGGVLVEYFGYRVATTAVAFLSLAVTLVTFTYFTVRHNKWKVLDTDPKESDKDSWDMKVKDVVPLEKTGLEVIH